MGSFHGDLADLNRIDWPLLQKRDFKRDAEDPAKFERYQAEALVQQFVPLQALLGIVCFADGLKIEIGQKIAQQGLILPVHTRPAWYF